MPTGEFRSGPATTEVAWRRLRGVRCGGSRTRAGRADGRRVRWGGGLALVGRSGVAAPSLWGSRGHLSARSTAVDGAGLAQDASFDQNHQQHSFDFD